MSDEITSHRVIAARTRGLPEEPETMFLTFETATGESFTFHMRTGEFAVMAKQMEMDAKGFTQ